MSKVNKRFRYRKARIHSHLAAHLDARSDDLFSEMIHWLGHHTWLMAFSILICFLLLSFACDRVLEASDASISEVRLLEFPEAGKWSPSCAPTTGASSPQSALSSRLLFSELFSEGALFFGIFPEGSELDGGAGWRDRVGLLAFRLALAALLGAVLTFRPRRSFALRHRSPNVVESQILLAVVACALMMIVGDSAARAFGIFAATSLVRFRTSIRDPKEITVLLVNLGIGLAAGVGRWDLAIVFTLFVLILLQVLDRYEDHQALELMELSVRTHDVEATDEAIRDLFKRNDINVGVRELNKETDKHPLGKVVYSIDFNHKLNTERLAEEIYSADPIHIERLEWHRKKAPSFG